MLKQPSSCVLLLKQLCKMAAVLQQHQSESAGLLADDSIRSNVAVPSCSSTKITWSFSDETNLPAIIPMQAAAAAE
jgi:hypothetical protein